jgi:MFS family permease
MRTNARWLLAGALLSFSSSYGQTFFISIFAGEIMSEFDLSNGQWGGIYSIGTTGSALVMLWAGALTDRFRVKFLGPVFLAMLAFVAVMMALVPGAWALPFIIFGLRFAGQGMISHVAIVAMARWFSATRGKAIALASLGFSIGEAMLPITFVALLAFVSWRSLWVLAAVMALTAIPLLSGLLKRERTPQSVVTGRESFGMHGKHWTRKDALGHWLFWLMLPSITAPGMFGTALFFQQVHLAETKGWELTHFVALFPLFTSVTVVSMLVYGWAIDRWGCGRLIPVFQIPMAVAFLFFGLGDSLVMAALGFILMGLMQGGAATLSGAFWSEFYGTRHLGSVKALATSMMVFGSALGPGLTGLLIDRGINFEDQMVFIAGYVLVVCGLTYFAMKWSTRYEGFEITG